MDLTEQEKIDLDLVNNYVEKYVVFLDLLGFAQLVRKIGQDVFERHRVVEALKLVRDTLSQNPIIDLRFTYFSDCIVISAERSPHGLWELFQSLELLTLTSCNTICSCAAGLPRHRSITVGTSYLGRL